MGTYYENKELAERWSWSTELARETETAHGDFHISHGYATCPGQASVKVSTVTVSMGLAHATIVRDGWIEGDPEAVFWESLVRFGGVFGVRDFIAVRKDALRQGRRALQRKLRDLLGIDAA